MSTHQSSDFQHTFSNQLRSTRDKIGTLPAEQRAYFQSLADEVERIHYQMQEKGALVRGLIDDMRLREANEKFHLWADALQVLGNEA